MISILSEAEAALIAEGGKPNKLVIEDRLLMTLEYLREYRTYFHISRSYGISESACYRNRRKRFGLRFNLIAGIYNFEL